MALTNFLPVNFALPSIDSPGLYADSTNDQFHIQTDEGPERYFRYQTQSGQYRKEKRLQDGTVVGSYGWIDSTGLLRLRDYIADNAGYRILRTKDVYVGRNRPISQAIKAAKHRPSITETGIENVPLRNLPVLSTTPKPSTFLTSTYTPRVHINHNSYPEELKIDSTLTSFDSSKILPPPVNSTPATLRETLLASSRTTPSPFLTSISSKQIPLTSPSVLPTSDTLNSYSSTPYPLANYYDSLTLTSQINTNSLEDFYDTNRNPYIHRNGPTYPIDRHGNSYFGRSRLQNHKSEPVYLENSYYPQTSKRDGQSVTNDGFRYYIPRSYHEEQGTNFGKSGSFGYIDPFGIRRVVYYKADSDGFHHKKNNRYVGFNAAPFDPIPYKSKK